MDSSPIKILMITPYANIQRGNSLTTARLQNFLGKMGYHIDRLSLEDHDWEHALREILQMNSYSLVHGFNARYAGQILARVPDLSFLPIILTATGTDINYDLYSPHRDLVINGLAVAQKIVVFNDSFRPILQDELPDLTPKLVTIPQGVYLEPGPMPTRQEIGLTEENFVFLLPSGLRPVKNIELAVAALRDLHEYDPRVRLLIIGAVLDEKYAGPLLSQAGKKDWIIYRGEVVHRDMKGLLSLGDVVLNTSHAEGQPQAALEAMSLGKPCILSAVRGNLNIIEPGQEGFYARDKSELIWGARQLLDSPLLRHQMGLKARLLVEKKFSLSQELSAYRQLYEEIAIHP